MRYRAIIAATAATLTGLATMAVTTTTAGAAPSPTGQLHSARVCAAPTAGNAACMLLVRTDANGKPIAAITPNGFGPASIQSAYKLAGLSSAGRTVAIVDAYNDPTAEADLGVYRAQFGLSACTTANGCFRKVDQAGGTKYPRTNSGWAQEISLDLDMVSAACPDCKILLVEANSASFANLGAAVITAAGIAPARICTVSTIAIPRKMKTPKPPPPITAAMVAVPMVVTVAMRMPARIMGTASGISTWSRSCQSVMPMATADSRTAGSIPRMPTSVFRRTGSSA